MFYTHSPYRLYPAQDSASVSPIIYPLGGRTLYQNLWSLPLHVFAKAVEMEQTASSRKIELHVYTVFRLTSDQVDNMQEFRNNNCTVAYVPMTEYFDKEEYLKVLPKLWSNCDYSINEIFTSTNPVQWVTKPLSVLELHLFLEGDEAQEVAALMGITF